MCLIVERSQVFSFASSPGFRYNWATLAKRSFCIRSCACSHFNMIFLYLWTFFCVLKSQAFTMEKRLSSIIRKVYTLIMLFWTLWYANAMTTKCDAGEISYDRWLPIVRSRNHMNRSCGSLYVQSQNVVNASGIEDDGTDRVRVEVVIATCGSYDRNVLNI